MHGDSKLTGLSIQFTIKKNSTSIEDGDGNQQLQPSKSLSKNFKFVKLDSLQARF